MGTVSPVDPASDPNPSVKLNSELMYVKSYPIRVVVMLTLKISSAVDTKWVIEPNQSSSCERLLTLKTM